MTRSSNVVLAAPIALILAILSLGVAGAALAAPAETFAYSPAALDIRTGPSHRPAPGVDASDISFASVGGRRVTGELIAPASGGRRGKPGPAILFVHWLGEPKTTNHTEFEADATRLAAKGFTCLLVDTMWAAPNWFDTMGADAAVDYRRTVDQVVDLRRALDLLAARPDVDPSRIAYVGHDFGAMMGALVAGVDARPSRYVLITPTATLPEWYLLGKKGIERGPYEAAFAPLSLTAALERSRAKAWLFQFSAKDDYVPQTRGLLFFAAAPTPKEALTYDAGHDLETPQAHADRIAWLLAELR